MRVSIVIGQRGLLLFLEPQISKHEPKQPSKTPFVVNNVIRHKNEVSEYVAPICILQTPDWLSEPGDMVSLNDTPYPGYRLIHRINQPS
jgi:hypothetical protein